MTVDGEIWSSRDLAVAGAGERPLEDDGEEEWFSEPVGGLESLETEGDAARQAEVPLDPFGRMDTGVEPDLLESPKC